MLGLIRWCHVETDFHDGSTFWSSWFAWMAEDTVVTCSCVEHHARIQIITFLFMQASMHLFLSFTVSDWWKTLTPTTRSATWWSTWATWSDPRSSPSWSTRRTPTSSCCSRSLGKHKNGISTSRPTSQNWKTGKIENGSLKPESVRAIRVGTWHGLSCNFPASGDNMLSRLLGPGKLSEILAMS